MKSSTIILFAFLAAVPDRNHTFTPHSPSKIGGKPSMCTRPVDFPVKSSHIRESSSSCTVFMLRFLAEGLARNKRELQSLVCPGRQVFKKSCSDQGDSIKTNATAKHCSKVKARNAECQNHLAQRRASFQEILFSVKKSATHQPGATAGLVMRLQGGEGSDFGDMRDAPGFSDDSEGERGRYGGMNNDRQPGRGRFDGGYGYGRQSSYAYNRDRFMPSRYQDAYDRGDRYKDGYDTNRGRGQRRPAWRGAKLRGRDRPVYVPKASWDQPRSGPSWGDAPGRDASLKPTFPKNTRLEDQATADPQGIFLVIVYYVCA
jgi:hypothetical protein